MITAFPEFIAELAICPVSRSSCVDDVSPRRIAAIEWCSVWRWRSEVNAIPYRTFPLHPQPTSAGTTTAYPGTMSSSTPREPGQVPQPEALSEHDLDAGYAQLATAFDNEAADADRRIARDRHARRSDDHL